MFSEGLSDECGNFFGYGDMKSRDRLAFGQRTRRV